MADAKIFCCLIISIGAASIKAVERTLVASADNGDGRGGVIWHTQGSAKASPWSFSAAS